MNEMREFAEELQEFMRKGQKLLNKMNQQSMGQRNHYGRMGYRDDGSQWGDMGDRNFMGGMGYDPRFT